MVEAEEDNMIDYPKPDVLPSIRHNNSRSYGSEKYIPTSFLYTYLNKLHMVLQSLTNIYPKHIFIKRQ